MHSLAPLLLGRNTTSPHQNTFFWREHTLYAVRQGAWKAHWVTRSGFQGDPPVTHNPPLLFNVEWDPAEEWPVNVTEYKDVLVSLEAAYAEHMREVIPGVPQYNVGNDWSLGLSPHLSRCVPLRSCVLTSLHLFVVA
jgi:hypothetical protein